MAEARAFDEMKHGSPAVSVIIVNFNASDLLADCVGAVLASPIALEDFVSDNWSAALCSSRT